MTQRRVWIPETVPLLPPTHHAVVEASAGTGKTFLLQHLFIDRLLNDEVTIDEIAVVTFTEKATEEIRQRIYEQLADLLSGRAPNTSGEPAWTIDNDARTRLQNAFRNFDQARISTIHSFCHSLVAENAFESGHLFDREQLASDSIFRPAFTNLLREIHGDSELNAFYSVWPKTADSLMQALRTLTTKGGTPYPPFTTASLKQAVHSLHEHIHTYLATPASRQEIAERSGCHPNARKKLLLGLHGLHEAVSQTSWIQQFSKMSPALNLALSRMKAPEGIALSFHEAVHPLYKTLPFPETAIVNQFLPYLEKHLRALKEGLSVFDFSDMLADALHFVQNASAETLRTLRQQTKHILIDEFQDTDPIQWELFHRLFADDETKITVVGDPKQAIYSFRGADVFTYFTATETLKVQNAKAARLNQNFRASKELIHATNEILMGPPPFMDSSNADAHVQAGRDEAGVQPSIVLLESENDQAAPMLDYFANEILSLAQQEIPYSDIFVLTRTTSESTQVIDSLKKYDIPAMVFKQEGLSDTQLALDLYDLLKSIAHPLSRSARLNALSTDFFRVTFQELTEPAVFDDWDAHFFHWNQLARQGALEKMFDEIILQTKVVQYWLARSDYQTITNLHHLIEKLCDAPTRDIEQLYQLLGFWRADPNRLRDGNIQRPALDTSSVQVMTMHASKGLESPYVFLYAKNKGRSDATKFFHDNTNHLQFEICSATDLRERRPEVAKQIDQELAQESQRLLYVALTRAKKRVYLPLWKKPAGDYKALNERLRDWWQTKPKFTELRNVPASVSVSGAVSESVSGSVSESVLKPGGQIPRKPLPSPPVPTRIVSYSQLHQQLSSNTLSHSSVQVSEKELPPGTQTGLFIHALLEHLNWQTLNIEPPLSLEQWREETDLHRVYDRIAAAYGFSQDDYSEATRLVYQTLTQSFVPNGPQLFTAEKQLREFVFHAKLDEQTLLHGIYDLLLEHNDALYLVDYKTNVLADYSPEAVVNYTKEHYRWQYQIYCITLASICDQLNQPMGGISYIYCRGRENENGLFFIRPTPEEIRQWRSALLEVIR